MNLDVFRSKDSVRKSATLKERKRIVNIIKRANLSNGALALAEYLVKRLDK